MERIRRKDERGGEDEPKKASDNSRGSGMWGRENSVHEGSGSVVNQNRQNATECVAQIVRANGIGSGSSPKGREVHADVVNLTRA